MRNIIPIDSNNPEYLNEKHEQNKKHENNKNNENKNINAQPDITDYNTSPNIFTRFNNFLTHNQNNIQILLFIIGIIAIGFLILEPLTKYAIKLKHNMKGGNPALAMKLAAKNPKLAASLAKHSSGSMPTMMPMGGSGMAFGDMDDMEGGERESKQSLLSKLSNPFSASFNMVIWTVKKFLKLLGLLLLIILIPSIPALLYCLAAYYVIKKFSFMVTRFDVDAKK